MGSQTFTVHRKGFRPKGLFLFLFTVLAGTSALAQNATIAIPGKDKQVGDDYANAGPQPRPTHNTKFEVRAGMGAKRRADIATMTTLGSGYLEASGERNFGKYLSGNFLAGAYFASGSGASLYQTDATSYEYFAISQASITLKPLEMFDVEAGILGRPFTTLPAFFAAEGFLGAAGNVNLGDPDGIHVTLQARQQFLTSEADQNAPNATNNPKLTMLGADVTFKSRQFNFGLAGHFFDFTTLPAAVANQAIMINDTTSMRSPVNSFAYDFRGLQFGANALWTASKRFDLGLKGGYIVNNAAAPGTGAGYLIAIGSKYVLNPTVTLKPELGTYYNERNVIPAPYVSSAYEIINRRSYRAYLGVELPIEKVTLFGSVTQANMLDKNTAQIYTDRTIYQIGVEAAYDIL